MTRIKFHKEIVQHISSVRTVLFKWSKVQDEFVCTLSVSSLEEDCIALDGIVCKRKEKKKRERREEKRRGEVSEGVTAILT